MNGMHVACRRLGRSLAVQLCYRSASSSTWCSSYAVRQRFLEYFVNENDHEFIRSSPVRPLCDPTVPFVNAGMNQFKTVFTGQNRAPCNRAANSQKCIRVGGKHNDIDAVGSDGYHHTFFEMLGSWSFGDYFKEKACRLAWDLLTGPYGLNPDRLYVTFFGGDEKMNLDPDLETRDIWNQIGVLSDHVLPFGANENFWEMGISGPCGPCTEIHFDHVAGRQAAHERVNKDFNDLTEIWNIVFIQYNRTLDGCLKPLPQNHVDTGMGLERLVAILQGEQSNYNTDLFKPLFDAIHKQTGAAPYTGCFGTFDTNGLDTGYRILSDHARMITVALADGIFPDSNPKLRCILRRAMCVAQKLFNHNSDLLCELTNHVAESLASTYPEIGIKLKQIHLIIRHEEELLWSLQKGAVLPWKDIVSNNPKLCELDVIEVPALVSAYHELDAVAQIVPAEMAFKLYDTFGLNEHVICSLAAGRGLAVDISGFRELLCNVRRSSKEAQSALDIDSKVPHTLVDSLINSGITPTDDSPKYVYYKEGSYTFPPTLCEIQAIFVGDQRVSSVEAGKECNVLLNRTNFYHESGGQAGDTGYLILQDVKMVVSDVVNSHGYLIHKGSINGSEGCFHVGDKVMSEISSSHRLGIMRNHTATHLLNAALHHYLTVTCQKSSSVKDSHLAFDFSIYGQTFNVEDVAAVEQIVQRSIHAGAPVYRRTVSAQELHTLSGVTLVPGEVYPLEGIHLIEIEGADELSSREACCGTHVLNTSDVDAFCIISIKSAGTGVRSLRAVTGAKARKAFCLGEEMKKDVSKLSTQVQQCLKNNTIHQVDMMEESLLSLKQKLTSYEQIIPYVVQSFCLNELETLAKSLKAEKRSLLRESIETEMKMVLQKVNRESDHVQPYIVHFLQCSLKLDSVPLQKAAKMCPHLPVLLLAYSEGLVKAKCCIPKEFVTDNFNAQLWMRPVLAAFNSQGYVPRGQNELFTLNMKGKKVKIGEVKVKVDKAIRNASEFAKIALQSKHQ